MFSLVKLLISLLFLAVFIWFGATVKLGQYTLFGHVKRIWHSEEAKALGQGAKAKASEVVDGVTRTLDEGEPQANPPPAVTPDAGPIPADAGPVTAPKPPGKTPPPKALPKLPPGGAKKKSQPHAQ